MFMNEVVDNTNDSATSNRQKDAVNNCGAAAIAAAAGLFEAEAATGCLSASTFASLCISFSVMFAILACKYKNRRAPEGARRCSWARRSQLSHRIILRWDKGTVPLSRFALPNGCLLAYALPVAASMPARRPNVIVRPQAKPVNRFG